MQYYYSIFGGFKFQPPPTHLLGDSLSWCQIIKENQNSLYGLHFAANIINLEITLCVFPHHSENVTEAFEKFLKNGANRHCDFKEKGKEPWSAGEMSAIHATSHTPGSAEVTKVEEVNCQLVTNEK